MLISEAFGIQERKSERGYKRVGGPTPAHTKGAMHAAKMALDFDGRGWKARDTITVGDVRRAYREQGGYRVLCRMPNAGKKTTTLMVEVLGLEWPGPSLQCPHCGHALREQPSRVRE